MSDSAATPEPPEVSVTIGDFIITQNYRGSHSTGCLWIAKTNGEGQDLGEQTVREMYEKTF